MRVTIIQPNVPHYRRPLFDALAAQPELSLSVVSAARGHGTQNSGHISGMPYLDDNHPWQYLLPGGALLWQRGLGRVPLGEAGDVVVVCGNLRYLSNYPLMLRARRHGIGVVWWSHGRSLQPKVFVERQRLRVMNWCDAVLLYTDAEVEAYIRQGFHKEKLFATNNAVDTKPIEAAKRLYDADRLELFRKAQSIENPLLLYCGRIKPSSRLDLAIEALAQLTSDGHRCDLAVIGEGDGRGELAALADRLGVAQQVRWLGAIYDQEELAPWYMTAAAFVYPGSIGLSLIHALNYGLPVITHNNRANHKPEISALEDSTNGLLFTEGDVGDLAAKITVILSNSSRRKMLSENALRTVHERYGLNNMITGIVEAVKYASARSLKRA